MEFGTFLLLQSPGARTSEEVFAFGTRIAQEADRLGFGSVWCAEHHFSTYGYLSRPLMFATHLAAHTDRIRVGSAVVVLPLHHPCRRGDRDRRPAEQGASRCRPRPRLSDIRVRTPRHLAR